MFKNNDAYLVGYYGMRNSGDDALMYAATWGAKNLLQCDTTTIGLYGDHHRQHPGTRQLNLHFNQVFPGQNRLDHYKTAIKSKRIIFGGGAVLHSESDINLKRHIMKLSNPNKSLAVGVSIGPFQSISAEKSCAHFLNECGYIGVRDQSSFDIAKSIAPNANVKKTFDLAPLLLCANKRLNLVKARSGIAFALCSVAINPMGKVDKQAEKKRITEFCQLITAIYKNTGEHITLLDFNGHSLLGDWKINNPVMAKLQHTIPITIEPYNPNPFAVIEDIASYKLLISMRLHGSILGYVSNTPVISLNYHEKCLGWCDQIGMQQAYQQNLQHLNNEELLCSIEQGLEHGFNKPALSIDHALQQALSNWSISYEQAKIYSSYSAIQQS